MKAFHYQLNLLVSKCGNNFPSYVILLPNWEFPFFLLFLYRDLKGKISVTQRAT